MKIKEEMTEEKHLKKRNKNKKGKASVQKNTCVNEGHLTDLDPEEQPCVQADDKPGKKKRKERNVTECLDNARNDEEISKKKKKKKQVGDYEVEAPLRKIQGSSNKKKKKKSKCADIEHAEIDAEEEAPKKAEKKKNKPREPIKEKKNSTADESTNNDIDEKHVPKKHKKSKINLAENQETSEETGGVEEVKKNKMAPVPEDVKKTKKRQVNPVLVAESNEGVKKKNKSAKSGDINVEEEKKKKKARKTSVECADAEETKPRKNKTSKQDKQDEEQQREENLDTRTDRKHRKRKECTATAEAPEAPCSEKGTKRKKKKAREEVEDQQVSTQFKEAPGALSGSCFKCCFSYNLKQEPSQAAVGFLSVKNGNADEVTINQVSRALFIFMVLRSCRNGKQL